MRRGRAWPLSVVLRAVPVARVAQAVRAAGRPSGGAAAQRGSCAAPPAGRARLAPRIVCCRPPLNHCSARRRLSECLIRRKMSLASRAWFSGTAIVATGTATLLVVCCGKPSTRRSRVLLLSTGTGCGGASKCRLRRPMRVDATAPSVCMYAYEHCVRTLGCRFFSRLDSSLAVLRH